MAAYQQSILYDKITKLPEYIEYIGNIKLVNLLLNEMENA